MKKVLLSHFYNEQWMLPWFLNHHKTIFDHGIMIDYHSTDHSCDIIREICPDWEIVTSRNPDFQADKIDTEVSDIEKSIDGWRICLNVTEQLIGDYSILDDDPKQRHYLLPSLFIVDTDYKTQVANPDFPLYEQYKHGFSFKDSQQHFLERRARSIHNYPFEYPTQSTRECMAPGRHFNFATTDQLVVLYYGWAPFDQNQLGRKLQIQTQIPNIDRQRGWGFHHITDDQGLEQRLNEKFIPMSRDITEDLDYYVKKHRDLSDIL